MTFMMDKLSFEESLSEMKREDISCQNDSNRPDFDLAASKNNIFSEDWQEALPTQMPLSV